MVQSAGEINVENIIMLDCIYTRMDGGTFQVVEWQQDLGEFELHYYCSDGMYRNKYGQAFPDRTNPELDDYSVNWDMET